MIRYIYKQCSTRGTKKGAVMNKIKIFRNDKKLSQKELAEKAGVGRSYLSCLENGKRNPNTKTLSKIAAALNCKVGELID
jgi:transcriptional regulator with XRE-family HTH domain